ncbi:terminase family protein [Candidatus Bathyarchaeota archaeon]|nr:terminase family protein [Candidatus Bathyarchaeota archaeon]
MLTSEQRDVLSYRAKVEAARRHPTDCSLALTPRWVDNWHLRKIGDALVKAEAEGHGRLIINTPPRSGKSQLCTRMFPMWYIYRHPDTEIAVCAYNEDKSKEFSREAMYLLDQDPDVLPIRWGDRKADAERITLSGGAVRYVGIGSGLTGKGAKVVVIDDPYKDRADADSEASRIKVEGWYNSVIESRDPDIIVIVHTRWRQDDLTGYLLKTKDEDWTQLIFPALLENPTEGDPRKVGEGLFPIRGLAVGRPTEELIRLRDRYLTRGMEREWYSLYQCRPHIEGAGFLPTNRIQYRTDVPPKLRPREGRCIQSWDLSTGKHSTEDLDWQVGVCMARDDMDHWWLLDAIRIRLPSNELSLAMFGFADKWRPTRIMVEDDNGWAHMKTWVMERQRSRAIKHLWWSVPTQGKDKVSNAIALQLLMGRGDLIVAPNISCWPELLEELATFPATLPGIHDDAVTALSQLARVAPGLPEVVVSETETKEDNDDFNKQIDDCCKKLARDEYISTIKVNRER